MDAGRHQRWQEIAWQSKREFFHHSDRAAIDLGLAGLNAITLLNGGAIVALLAFVGQVWSNGKGAGIVKAIIHAGIPFVCGMVASGVCFFVAYIYQSSVTWNAGIDLAALFAQPPGQDGGSSWAKRVCTASKVFMLLFALAAVVFFGWGVVRVSGAFLSFIAIPSPGGAG